MKELLFEFSFRFGTKDQYFIVDVQGPSLEAAIALLTEADLGMPFTSSEAPGEILRIVVQPPETVTEEHLDAIYGPLNNDNETPRGWTLEEFKARPCAVAAAG